MAKMTDNDLSKQPQCKCPQAVVIFTNSASGVVGLSNGGTACEEFAARRRGQRPTRPRRRARRQGNPSGPPAARRPGNVAPTIPVRGCMREALWWWEYTQRGSIGMREG